MLGNLHIKPKDLDKLPIRLTPIAYPAGAAGGNLTQIKTYGQLGTFFAGVGQDIKTIPSISALIACKKDGLDCSNLSQVANGLQDKGVDIQQNSVQHLLDKTIAELEIRLKKMQAIESIFQDINQETPSRFMAYLKHRLIEVDHIMQADVYGAHIENPLMTGKASSSPINFERNGLTVLMQQLQQLIAGLKNLHQEKALPAIAQFMEVFHGHVWADCLSGNAGDIEKFNKKLIPINALSIGVHDAIQPFIQKYNPTIADISKRHIPTSILRHLGFDSKIINAVDHYEALNGYTEIIQELKTKKSSILHSMFEYVVNEFNTIAVELMDLQNKYNYQQHQDQKDSLLNTLAKLHIYKKLNQLAMIYPSYFEHYALGKDMVQINDIKIQVPTKDKEQFDEFTKTVCTHFNIQPIKIQRSFGQKLLNINAIEITQEEIDGFIAKKTPDWQQELEDFKDEDDDRPFEQRWAELLAQKKPQIPFALKRAKMQNTAQNFATFALSFNAIAQDNAAQTHQKLNDFSKELNIKPNNCQMTCEDAYLTFNESLKHDVDDFNLDILAQDIQKNILQDFKNVGVHFIAIASLQDVLMDIKALLPSLEHHETSTASSSKVRHTEIQEIQEELTQEDKKGKGKMPAYQKAADTHQPDGIKGKKSTTDRVHIDKKNIIPKLTVQYNKEINKLSSHAQFYLDMLNQTKLSPKEKIDVLPYLQKSQLPKKTLSDVLQLMLVNVIELPENFVANFKSIEFIFLNMPKNLSISSNEIIKFALNINDKDKALAFLEATSHIRPNEQKAFFDIFHQHENLGTNWTVPQIKNMHYLWQKTTNNETVYDFFKPDQNDKYNMEMSKNNCIDAILSNPNLINGKEHGDLMDIVTGLKFDRYMSQYRVSKSENNFLNVYLYIIDQPELKNQLNQNQHIQLKKSINDLFSIENHQITAEINGQENIPIDKIFSKMKDVIQPIIEKELKGFEKAYKNLPSSKWLDAKGNIQKQAIHMHDALNIFRNGGEHGLELLKRLKAISPQHRANYVALLLHPATQKRAQDLLLKSTFYSNAIFGMLPIHMHDVLNIFSNGGGNGLELLKRLKAISPQHRAHYVELLLHPATQKRAQELLLKRKFFGSASLGMRSIIPQKYLDELTQLLDEHNKAHTPNENVDVGNTETKIQPQEEPKPPLSDVDMQALQAYLQSQVQEFLVSSTVPISAIYAKKSDDFLAQIQKKPNLSRKSVSDVDALKSITSDVALQKPNNRQLLRVQMNERAFNTNAKAINIALASVASQKTDDQKISMIFNPEQRALTAQRPAAKAYATAQELAQARGTIAGKYGFPGAKKLPKAEIKNLDQHFDYLGTFGTQKLYRGLQIKEIKSYQGDVLINKPSQNAQIQASQMAEHYQFPNETYTTPDIKATKKYANQSLLTLFAQKSLPMHVASGEAQSWRHLLSPSQTFKPLIAGINQKPEALGRMEVLLEEVLHDASGKIVPTSAGRLGYFESLTDQPIKHKYIKPSTNLESIV